jgi:hypothetical protein
MNISMNGSLSAGGPTKAATTTVEGNEALRQHVENAVRHMIVEGDSTRALSECSNIMVYRGGTMEAEEAVARPANLIYTHIGPGGAKFYVCQN